MEAVVWKESGGDLEWLAGPIAVSFGQYISFLPEETVGV